MIEVDVKRRLGSFALEAKFSAGPGVTALFGPSGAGKTTIVNLLAGLDRPDAGRIIVDGRTLFDSEGGVDLPPERRRLGYVFQEGRLFPHLSVNGNLTYGMRLIPPEARQHDFSQIVSLLGLSGLLDRRPGSLSGGEKQRVAIGRALLASPRLLLMDEPLSSLDGVLKEEILPYIERLRDELRLPIVYVSHAIEEVIRLADTLVVLDGGKVVEADTLPNAMGRLRPQGLTDSLGGGAVFRATVGARDEDDGLTELLFGPNRLLVPRMKLAPGASLRVRIQARDVALSRGRPSQISVLNIFEGTIREIGPSAGPQVDVLVDIGAPLIARITRKSLQDLGLAVGDRIHALIKAVAVDRRNLGGLGDS